MAWRWRKSIGLGKLVRVNLSRRGAGVSVGVPGARVGTGTRGAYTSVSVPGTGLYKLTRLTKRNANKALPTNKRSPSEALPREGGSTSASPSMESILRFVVIVAFLLLAAFVVIGLAGCAPAPEAQAIAAETPKPVYEQPKPEPAQLVPGQYYQSSAPFKVLVAASKLENVQAAGLQVPGGGVFLYNGPGAGSDGLWWSATVWDTAGGSTSGYIDGYTLLATQIRPYIPDNPYEQASVAQDPIAAAQRREMQNQVMRNGTRTLTQLPATATSTNPSMPKDPIVFVSTSGDGERYHRRGCSSLSRSATQSMSVAQAQSKGFSPCRKCSP